MRKETLDLYRPHEVFRPVVERPVVDLCRFHAHHDLVGLDLVDFDLDLVGLDLVGPDLVGLDLVDFDLDLVGLDLVGPDL